MASVLKINDRWRALIRRKGHAAQCKTFGTKAAAEVWARQRENDLDRGVVTGAASTVTVGAVIQAYRRLREASRPISDASTEHYILKTLDAGLGHHVAAKLSPEHLVAFAQMRREDGAGPYTTNMDISKLGTVLRYGSAALKIALPDAVQAARPTLTYLRLIGGGGKRERRPTQDELERVLEAFAERHGSGMRDAVAFAATSAMRLGEVTAIRWVDLNVETKMVAVMRKHPRKGKTLERVPLLERAWSLVQAQPRTAERIFPFGAGTLSKYFTNICRELSIPDLHFHDLRHEGTSALFEAGYSIEQVALITGHKDWRNLRRYANLRPEDVHRVKV